MNSPHPLMSRPSLRILCILFALILTAAACKGAPQKRKGKATSAKPVAEARQAIETPTLQAPVAAPQPKAPPPEPEAAAALPRGPITLPAAPDAPAAAPVAAATPGTAAPGSAVTTPAGTPPAPAPTPQAAPTAPATMPPTAEGAALAQLPGMPSQPPPSGGPLQALAAPEIAQPEAPSPASAQEVKYEPKLVTARTNIEVLLDASGSMSAPLGMSSSSKFDVVRQALLATIYEMGQQQSDFPRNLAIRLFGSKQEAAQNDCQDTELLIGMGEPNQDAILAALTKVEPRGASPIAFALNEAGKDFPGGIAADRVVVLVADGSDTCGGDPCAAASRLQEGNVKTVVHTIAFDVAPEDQVKLECVAKSSDGLFIAARNEAELRQGLEQAINSTIPYNLKLIVQSGGGAPMPVKVVVFKAGTEEVVRRGEGTGTKLLNLPPGTYDVLVEYAKSPEEKKPSKILKGVEVLSTTRLEQTITFDLGQINLAASNSEGKPAAARFRITKENGAQIVASFEGGPEPFSVFLPYGIYDISADPVEAQAESFTLTEGNLESKGDIAVDLQFKFQKGTLALKGQTTLKEPIPFIFQVYKAGTQSLIASGALPADGGSVLLAPGTYDLIVTGADPKMSVSPRTRISGIAVKASDTTELVAMFEMGTLKVTAFDGKGNRVPAEFVIQDPESKSEITRVTSSTGAQVTASLPPGTYNIVAYSLKSILEPKPSVVTENVAIVANAPTEQAIQFVLGTLRLLGRNAKESPIRTQFTIYRAASDELVTKAPPSSDWMVFDLAPGRYDALAVDMSGNAENRPMIWIRDIKVDDGKTVSHEAIFTAGKLKVIGRGPNNRIITCGFKVFRYGSDRELINGTTGDDWEIFEIEPGKYYIEASWHDEEQSVTLKKWINIGIGENEIVELVIRF